MLKRLLTIALLAPLFAVVAPSPAQADDGSGAWVTGHEYHKVKYGMNKLLVNRILGTRGKKYFDNGTARGKSYAYGMKASNGRVWCVSVDYQYRRSAWRVLYKSRAQLRQPQSSCVKVFDFIHQ